MTARAYLENPLLFINSTSSAVPKGRNVRTQARTQQASLLGPARRHGGCFSTLDLKVKRHDGDEDASSMRKRRKAVKGPAAPFLQQCIQHDSPLSVNLSTRYSSPMEKFDPSEVLAVATFHIRRIAAMTVLARPDSLRDVLRCRQWSCVSFALERFGKSRYLDTAFFCVAAKLEQITSGKTSSLAVLSSYEEALHELQGALMEPKWHNNLDLLTSTQLLAVYEMLDSLESQTWTKHIAGATSLAQPFTLVSYEENHNNTLSFAQAATMFTDALLTGNDDFFRRYPWRAFRRSALQQNLGFPESCKGLVSCLLELPELLGSTILSGQGTEDLDSATRYVLLDRAHVLKACLRSALLQSHLYSRIDFSALESFDKLGMCLAGLVAVDRLIASLRPVELRDRESAEDKTSELCAQLLQLELGAADAYPATDLMAAFQMSTFQEQAGFVIVLPGPRGG